MVLPPSPFLALAAATAAAVAAKEEEEEPGSPGVGVVAREMDAGEAFEDECDEDEPSKGDSLSSAVERATVSQVMQVISVSA